MFASILICEKNDDGAYVMTFFQDKFCFQGVHFLHSFVAVTMIALTIIVTQLISLVFFESRPSSIANARMHTRIEVFRILAKSTYVVLFSFLRAP